MIVTLKNIGPIEEASFDLNKDLIVFIGPNNTGKTYAAYTVYGCYRIENQYFGVTIGTKNMDNSFTKLQDTGSITIDLYDCYLKNKDHIQEEYADILMDRLTDIFDTSENFFNDGVIHLLFNDELVKKSILEWNLTSNGEYRFEKDFALKINKNRNETSINYVLNRNFDNHFNSVTEINIKKRVDEYVDTHQIHVILQSVFGQSYFAPAERIAINLFSRPLLLQRNKLVEEVLTRTKDGNRDISDIFSRQKLYPLPIRDSLEIAEQLNEFQKRTSSYSYLADILESEILLGKVTVSEYGEVQFNPENTNIQLGIHLTGSIVKSLSSLVFYFRHIARKGDLLVIDEPELNLHPDNQRLVANILAKVSRQGIKVILSTHSDYIIRELNNLIMLNKEHPETKALREKYGYDESEILDHKRVGAYLFKDHTAKPIEVTQAGMEAATIDEVINKLNNTATDIYWTLFED